MQENKTAAPEERRLQRIAQLKAKLQKEEARLSKDKRKERDGQLIAFGVYVEEFFKSADIDGRAHLEESIKKYLAGRNLERALAGLARIIPRCSIALALDETEACASLHEPSSCGDQSGHTARPSTTS